MTVTVQVVDDEPDVEVLFRQQFRRDLRARRFVMDFASSAADALSRIANNIGHARLFLEKIARENRRLFVHWQLGDGGKLA